MAITTRAGKGDLLTHEELDTNFIELDSRTTNIDNTSDANKPVSDLTQTALDLKIDDTQVGVTIPSQTSATGATRLATGTTAERPGAPTEGMLRRNSETQTIEEYDGADWSTLGGGGGAYLLYHIQEQKAVGLDAGSSTNGNNRRILNTVLTDELGDISLNTGILTLPAGTYRIEGSSMIVESTANKSMIKNSDTSALLLQGLAGHVPTSHSINFRSYISGDIVLVGTTNIVLETWIQNAQVQFGLGQASDITPSAPLNVAPEIYADLKIWRIA